MSHSRVREIVRDLEREGWTFVSQNKHLKMRSPSGKSILSMSVSPSCRYAIKRIRKDADRVLAREAAGEKG